MKTKLLSLLLALAMCLSLAACGGGEETPETTNMGDAQTLYDFLAFANENYPTGNYAYSDAVTFDCADGEITTTIYKD